MPRPEKGCADKVRYVGRKHAERMARKASRRAGIPLYVYTCPHCLGHHMTKIPTEQFRRTQEQARNRRRARVPVGGYA